MEEDLYTLKANKQELAKIIYVMSTSTGITGGRDVRKQAIAHLGLSDNRVSTVFRIFEGKCLIYYHSFQNEWEKYLGVGSKSPVQQRIENLEKELDELKKLL